MLIAYYIYLCTFTLGRLWVLAQKAIDWGIVVTIREDTMAWQTLIGNTVPILCQIINKTYHLYLGYFAFLNAFSL